MTPEQRDLLLEAKDSLEASKLLQDSVIGGHHTYFSHDVIKEGKKYLGNRYGIPRLYI